MSIDIQRHLLYEDNQLFVVNKPSGLLVQAPDNNVIGTTTNTSPILNLLDAVKHYLQITHHKPRAWVGLVHRLDRPTSGVIVFAKTSKAASRLSSSFRTRACCKVYLCVVEGRLMQPGRCDNWLSKGEVGGQPVQVKDELSLSLSSSTEGSLGDSRYVKGVLSYRPLVHFAPPLPTYVASSPRGADMGTGSTTGGIDVHTICRIELETGRKHQIRAQMAHMGHPIVGDVKYGASQSFKQRDIALHAYMLTIAHPVTGKDMTFTAPPPALWSKRFGADSLAAAEGEMTAP